jgi:hypothetical protein
MGVRENVVEGYLDEQVKLLGGITRKWVSPGRDGVPDRIVILNGVVWFVEVKTVGGGRSNVQIREHQRLRDNGANVCTVYGKEGVDRLIDVW